MRRTDPGGPRLAVAGEGDAADRLTAAAIQNGYSVVSEGADLLYVASSHDLGASLDRSPDAAVGLSAAAIATLPEELHEELSTRSVRLTEPLLSAPAVRAFVGDLPTLGVVEHLSALGATEGLAASLAAAALISCRAAGWPCLDSATPTATGARLTFGDRAATIRWSPGADLAQWELQAATSAAVLRVALFPEPRLERNGDEFSLPAVGPIDAFGYTAALDSWRTSLRSGTPTAVDESFREALRSVCGVL